VLLNILQFLRGLNILTTVKYYDELLRKLKIDHYVRKEGLLNRKYKKILKAMIAVRTLYGALCERRERTVNTLHQLLARRRSVIDAIKTQWTLYMI